MTPDLIPVLIVFGAGMALGATIAWLTGLVRRVRRWRALCTPPPVPTPRPMPFYMRPEILEKWRPL